MASWDPTRAKSQLRITAQRLAQLRDRLDAQGQVASKDISTLLAQRAAALLARAKAQRLIQDEITADLLEHLEFLIAVLVERLGELDRAPGPAVVEAASSVIYAASFVDSKDLLAVRDLLAARLGPEFLQSAATNRDRCVSTKVIRALSAPPPSAADLDAYLLGIARTYKVQWEPELRADDVLRVLSELLDRSNSAPVVDLPRLRRVCAHGIPPSPSWLRPRTWRLLLGTLPVLKANWDKEAMKSRANYYELVRRLLEPFASLPPPTDPLAPLDAALANAVKDLFRVPHNLFAGLEGAPEACPECPLDAAAPDESRIACAGVLDARLEAIHALKLQNAGAAPALPDAMPSISVTAPEDGEDLVSATAASNTTTSTTRAETRAFSTGGAHAQHGTALIRLLYVHSCLNPANRSPHLASLLIPLYSVLLREVEPAELAHAEADTFWLFEALVGEFAELEDEEGGNMWMARLGERVAWADGELAADLHTKGLSPGLPHYSYRWLAPLLTHTLPLSSVLSVWDALFSCPPTTRDASPKLDCLLDICTAMLLRARGPISRLGKSGKRSSGLWGEESRRREPSPVRAWELNDAFIEGMALLQIYPVEAAGGIESILQTAADLAVRREEERRLQRSQPGTLGERLRNTVWRGFTNQIESNEPSPETSSEEEEEEGDDSTQDEGSRTEPVKAQQQQTMLGANIANKLWRGITNQSAMDAPLSPPASPLSPASSSHSMPKTPLSPPPNPAGNAPSLWSYAEKLRDSDTAAALAKASTNWRVKAIQAWGSRGPSSNGSVDAPSQSPIPTTKARSGSFTGEGSEKVVNDPRRGSLPGRDVEPYSPPPRPAYFRPPRDSWLPQPRRSPLVSPASPESIVEETPSEPDSASSRGHHTASIRESIASIAAFAAPSSSSKSTPKAGPRPLLLSSSNLMTGPSPQPSRAPSRTPSRAASRSPMPPRSPAPHARQDSTSSFSTSGHRSNRGSDIESDATESRVVRLNRASVSPMAIAARQARMSSKSSPGASDQSSPTMYRAANKSPGSARSSNGHGRGWAMMADVPDSPGTVPSSPPPPTPPPAIPPSLGSASIAVSGSESHRGSLVMRETDVRVLDPPARARKLARKGSAAPSIPSPSPPLPPSAGDTSDSSSATHDNDGDSVLTPSPTRGLRLRSKRSGAQLAYLNIAQDNTSPSLSSPVDTSARVRSPRSPRSPSSAVINNTLAPPPAAWDEHESVTTPRAAVFPSRAQLGVGSGEDDDGDDDAPAPRSPRRRKTSGESVRARKVSAGENGGPVRRARKLSGSTDANGAGESNGGYAGAPVRVRKVSDARTVTGGEESGAEMGDDEGYDDLLSAYESEDSVQLH